MDIVTGGQQGSTTFMRIRRSGNPLVGQRKIRDTLRLI